MDKRILNPRTNRYVTIGSPSHRKLLREGVITPTTKTKTKVSDQPLPMLDSDSDLDDSMFERKQSKKDKPLKKEIVKKSVKLIKKNEDKFRKVKDSQSDTDRLLKKLLYKKLMKDDSSDSDSDY